MYRSPSNKELDTTCDTDHDLNLTSEEMSTKDNAKKYRDSIFAGGNRQLYVLPSLHNYYGF